MARNYRKNTHTDEQAKPGFITRVKHTLAVIGIVAGIGYALPDDKPEDKTVHAKPTHIRITAAKPPAAKSVKPTHDLLAHTEGMEITEEFLKAELLRSNLPMEHIVSEEIKSAAAPVQKSVEKKVLTSAAHITNGAMPKLVKRNINGSEVYTVGPKTVTLSPSVADAFSRVEREKGLPREIMIATCARESNCEPRAVNPNSKACGLFQLMVTPAVQTLPRLAFTQGAAHGYPEAKALVTEYVHAHDKKGRAILRYLPKDTKAEKKLAELCFNPHFNASMLAVDMEPKIRKYEAWLKGDAPTGRKISVGEIAVVNNLGDNGAIRFMGRVFKDVRTGIDTMAYEFLSPAIAAQNPSFVRYPDGRYKTMRESYRDISNSFGGYTERDQIQRQILTPSQEL
ncbi:MAG: hypothetical protein WBK55_01655 [Alphaproteobacteria bacterium]